MKISVLVKIKAKKEKVEQLSSGEFKVFVKEAPQEGRANQAVLRVLAKYLNKAQGSIKIIKGLKSKRKIIEID